MDVEKYIPNFRYPKDTAEVEFVRASKEDGAAINDLYNRAFDQKRTFEEYLWKYWQSPAGPPFGILAREKETGKYLSTSTGVTKQVWVQGREVPGILTCETSSDPDARGGGRLFKGVMQGFGVAVNDERGIVWSFGGQSSDEAIKIGKRWFGFQIVVELVTWECVLSLEPALRSRLGGLGGLAAGVMNPLHRARWKKCGAGLSFSEIHRFDAAFDQLWEEHRDRYGVVFWRDAATLNWRYVDNPFWKHRIVRAERDGQLAGYLVWREWDVEGSRIATVLDAWHGEDQEVLEGLLDQARRSAAKTGCAFLRFAIKAGGVEQSAFEGALGGRPSPYERVDKIICTPMPGSNPYEQSEEAYEVLGAVMDGSNWYYCQGDCDFRD
ncbi:MAG: hypothetical protein ACPG31_12265 [Planctomycetota bacterium]